MTPGRAHAQAVYDLIVAAVPATTKVYRGEITTPDADLTYPYLVVWPPPPTREDDALEGFAGHLSTTTQVTAAGASVDEVLHALDLAAGALHKVTPTIAGRSCAPFRQVPGASPPQPTRDPEVRTADGRPIFFSFILVELHSTLA